MPIRTVETRNPYPSKLVTLGRMHIGFGQIMKLVALVVHDPTRKDDEGNPVEESHAIIDEDAFLSLLAATFPRGELDNLRPPPKSESVESLPQKLDATRIQSWIEHTLVQMMLPLLKGKTVKTGEADGHDVETQNAEGIINDISVSEDGTIVFGIKFPGYNDDPGDDDAMFLLTELDNFEPPAPTQTPIG